jgi:hypothetical protein
MPEYKTYDDLFYETWKEVVSLKHVLPMLLAPKFEELGVQITDNQLAHIVEQIERGDENIDFGIDDEQFAESGIAPDADGVYRLVIDFSEEAERLDSPEEEMPTIFAELVPKFTEEWAADLQAGIERSKATRLKEESENRQLFHSILCDIWGEALDNLDVFIHLVTEAGCDFASEYHDPDTDKADHKFKALVGLHARACQIGKEILAPLREGFADGAHARWRSLHEVTVIAKFIYAQDQDLAEKYLLHHVIDARKAAYQHRKYADRLSEPPPTDAELAQLDGEYHLLRERFGDAYIWLGSRLV